MSVCKRDRNLSIQVQKLEKPMYVHLNDGSEDMMKNTITLKAIEKELLAQAHFLLPKWFPGGTWKHPTQIYYTINHIRGGQRCGLFVVHTTGKKASHWCDFMETSIYGTSLLQLFAYASQFDGWNSKDSAVQKIALVKAAKKLGYGGDE